MNKTYINKLEEHNKFWKYEINQNDYNVTISWGRLGLAGQKQTKTFSDAYSRDRFIEKKEAEKINGGYEEVTSEDFEVRTTIAKIIGTDSKLDEIKFVLENKTDSTPVRAGLVLKEVKAERLQDPALRPSVYARVIGRKTKSGDHPLTEFLFRIDQSYKITTTYNNYNPILGKTSQLTVCTVEPIKVDDDCEKLAEAVGTVIGQVLV